MNHELISRKYLLSDMKVHRSLFENEYDFQRACDVIEHTRRAKSTIEFTPVAISPDKPGHYLTISNMNWYHGGCFDDDRKTGLSLSYNVAYYNNGWNDPFVVAWCALPDFPEEYKEGNRNLLEERRKNLKPTYGTECYIG